MVEYEFLFRLIDHVRNKKSFFLKKLNLNSDIN